MDKFRDISLLLLHCPINVRFGEEPEAERCGAQPYQPSRSHAMSAPFVHRFRSGEKFYVYDVNTNNVLQVDELLYSLIDLVDIGEDFRCSLVPNGACPDGQTFSDADVRYTLEQIERYCRDQGLFTPHRPVRLVFPFTKQELSLILSHLVGHVVLNVTEDCNLRCAYCKYSGQYPYARTHGNRRMEEGTALAAIRFMLDRSDYLLSYTNENLGVGFYGGEPLLNFDLISKCVDFVLREASHLRDRITFAMTTNLALDKLERIDYLVDHDFSILVSLDGPQFLHDRYRVTGDGHGSFQRILRNLRRMRDRNPDYYEKKVGFSIVLAPPYDLPAVVDFFSREELLAGHRMSISFVDADDTAFFDRFPGMEEINSDLRAQMEQLRDRLHTMLHGGIRNGESAVLMELFGDRIRDLYHRRMVSLGEEAYPNGICIPGYQRFLVSPDGVFYMCEKIGYELPIGNLVTGFDIDAISSLIQDYASFSESDCVDCWALRLCKMCFQKCARGSEFVLEKKRRNCASAKHTVARGLRAFSEVMEVNPAGLASRFADTQTTGGMDLPFRFVAEHRKTATASAASNGT
jgi:uncharacterized protein